MASTLHALNRRARGRNVRHYCEFGYRRVANYEADPHFSLTKRQCGNEGIDCYLSGYEKKPFAYYCGEHCEIEGFCGCGIFCAGIESFDFGAYHGWCDNCASEIAREEEREQEDPYDDYDYNDEQGRMLEAAW